MKVGPTVQLVEHCSSVREVIGLNPVWVSAECIAVMIPNRRINLGLKQISYFHNSLRTILDRRFSLTRIKNEKEILRYSLTVCHDLLRIILILCKSSVAFVFIRFGTIFVTNN